MLIKQMLFKNDLIYLKEDRKSASIRYIDMKI